jgi:hypothetical protein
MELMIKKLNLLKKIVYLPKCLDKERKSILNFYRKKCNLLNKILSIPAKNLKLIDPESCTTFNNLINKYFHYFIP